MSRQTQTMAPRPTRRAVTRGLAWSVPVVAVAGAATAFAASPIACPTLTAGTGWTTTYTGTLGPNSSGGQGWDAGNTTFSVYRDNGSSTAPLTITSTATFDVVVGATYDVSFLFNWGYGNGVASQSTGGTFTLTINDVPVKTLTTRTAAVDGNTSVNGVQPGTTTQTFTLKPTTSTIKVTYEYTITPKTEQANDDINVSSLNFTKCVR
ncbi:hypothetical protein BCF74_11875 [Knoellia remsis]|uniref:Uncharacterized protein n=1 Tax=Knoellia remsis TaxID=407159 RepID=A0A2T0UFG4_9MICO|nr:hypothetical protein [Knoellia remsis]PRY56680.1 hypothetical protein BCF74_11875 [Knoellia remsis]